MGVRFPYALSAIIAYKRGRDALKTILVDDMLLDLQLFELKCADLPGFEIVGKFTAPAQAVVEGIRQAGGQASGNPRGLEKR